MKIYHEKPCKADLITTLTDKAMAARELATLLGRDSKTIAKILRNMGEENAYICSWDGAEAIWTLGNGKHVPRPVTAKTRKELAKVKKVMPTYPTIGVRIWGI